MRRNPIHQPPITWRCVLDRHWRQTYLATNETAAQAAMAKGSTLASDQTAGQAMKAVAMKAAEESRHRDQNPERR